MNQRELDILNILYQNGNPMIATEIVNARKDLTQSTVTAVLRALLRKELVEVAGIERSGKVLSRSYRPAPQAKEAILHYFVKLYKPFLDVIPSHELMAALEKEE